MKKIWPRIEIEERDPDDPVQRNTDSRVRLKAYDRFALLLCLPVVIYGFATLWSDLSITMPLGRFCFLLFLIGGGMVMAADVRQGHIRGVWRHRTPRLFYSMAVIQGLFVLIAVVFLLLDLLGLLSSQ